MRRLLYTMMLLVAVVATGCNKEKTPENIAPKLYGEWHCTPEGIDADVYVSFNDDGSFALYQRVGEGRYRSYSGSWFVKGTTLSGIYADESAWGSDYSVSLPDGDTMRLTALNGSEEVMTYLRTTIPAEVKEESTSLRSTADDSLRPWF